jgi:MSHA biogenesis protein MshM
LDLRQALARELRIVDVEQYDAMSLLDALHHRLIELAAQGKSTVLLIDEAQALPEETLEALRLLTNLETEQNKLLQVVLFGQPELDATLARHEFRQLLQRITFSYRLRPLDVTDTGRYLQERLSVAGYRGEPLFSRAAVRLLVRGSGGIPRLLNILGNKALMATYGEGRRQVGAAQVRRALADTDGVVARSGWPIWLSCSLVGGLASLLLFSVWPWLSSLREWLP